MIYRSGALTNKPWWIYNKDMCDVAENNVIANYIVEMVAMFLKILIFLNGNRICPNCNTNQSEIKNNFKLYAMYFYAASIRSPFSNRLQLTLKVVI